MEPKKAGRASGIPPASRSANASLAAHDRNSSQPPAPSASGLIIGTPVLTLDGELPVEHLCPGDRIITRDSGTAELISVEAAVVIARPVLVEAKSLGHTRPECDTWLAPGQNVLIRDWRARALYGAASAMVPVERLVDDRFVKFGDPTEMRLYRLRFDAPHVIYAGGLELGVEPVRRAA